MAFQFVFRNSSRWCVIVQICLTLRRKWGGSPFRTPILPLCLDHAGNLWRGGGARSDGGVMIAMARPGR